MVHAFTLNSIKSMFLLYSHPGLYDPNAVVTISCNFQGMGVSQVRPFQQYIDNSRNLVRTSNIDMIANLVYGQENAAKFWSSFKQSKHDMKSFTIDLTAFTVCHSKITVHPEHNNMRFFILIFSRCSPSSQSMVCSVR